MGSMTICARYYITKGEKVVQLMNIYCLVLYTEQIYGFFECLYE